MVGVQADVPLRSFLCSLDFAMPADRSLVYAGEVAPYLLGFTGSPAERLVENLKVRPFFVAAKAFLPLTLPPQILRTIGLPAYQEAVAHSSDPRLAQLRDTILERLLGPDRYYDPVESIARIRSLFGRVDVVPFPFTVIFRYDDSPAHPLYLVTIHELELLVKQNSSDHVLAARRVRLALRALEGQVAFAPHTETVSSESLFRPRAEARASYRQAVLRIERNSKFQWQGYNCSSGFDVQLEYSDGEAIQSDGRIRKGLRLTRSAHKLGVFSDFQLSKPLAILFRQNRQIIEARQPLVEATLQAHTRYFAHQAIAKQHALSYSMLLSAFLQRDLESLARNETCPVRQLATTHDLSVQHLQERWGCVHQSPGRTWWYLLWDDLWRRNRNEVNLPEHRFSPHYSTSICVSLLFGVFGTECLLLYRSTTP